MASRVKNSVSETAQGRKMTREDIYKEQDEALAIYSGLVSGDMGWMDIPGPERLANDEALVGAKARLVTARGLLEDMGPSEPEK